MSRPEARNLISIDMLHNFIVEFILHEMLFPFIPSLLPLEGVAIRSRVVPSQPLFFLRVQLVAFILLVQLTKQQQAQQNDFCWVVCISHITS